MTTCVTTPVLGLDATVTVEMKNLTIDDVLAAIQEESYIFSLPLRASLIVVNACLIVFGVGGNGLVCYVVARNANMRTPRNIFIINLAISDLSLSLFTQPFNLMKLLTRDWIFGNFVCKFVSMFQGTNVFVSTISITAIALDRFQVIVYPTKDSMKKIGAVVALLSIWVISLLISSPLLIFTYLDVKIIPLPRYDLFMYRCIEDEAMQSASSAYSIASLVVQYILPIMIVSIAHARICNKLKYRMTTRSTIQSPYHTRKKAREHRRKQRTNTLLAMIAVVFVLSWLPLNMCNILIDFVPELFRNTNVNLIFAICHMLVLSSACTNPVLYGWLNENFRTEFVKVLCPKWCNTFKQLVCMCCCCCCKLQRTTQASFDVPMIVLTREEDNQNGALGLGAEISVMPTSSMFPSSSDCI